MDAANPHYYFRPTNDHNSNIVCRICMYYIHYELIFIHKKMFHHKKCPLREFCINPEEIEEWINSIEINEDKLGMWFAINVSIEEMIKYQTYYQIIIPIYYF